MEWVPRDTNNLQIADYLSRYVSDPDDWSVTNFI